MENSCARLPEVRKKLFCCDAQCRRGSTQKNEDFPKGTSLSLDASWASCFQCCHLIIGNGVNAGDHLISDKTRSIILSNKSGDHVGQHGCSLVAWPGLNRKEGLPTRNSLV